MKKVSLNKATVSSGSFTITAPGYEFDGTDDYIDLNSVSQTLAYQDKGTISFWFNTLDSNGILWSLDDASNVQDFQYFGIISDILNFDIGEGKIFRWILGSANAYNDGEWHQIIYSSNGSSNSLAVDGVDQTSNITFTQGSNDGSWFSSVVSQTDIDEFTLGVLKNQSWNYSNGQISGLKIWNRILSASEIGYLHSKEKINY